MLVETTTEFDELGEAEDSLEGSKSVPGFVLGYVRLPGTPSQRYEVVTVFDCRDGGSVASRQRAVEHLAVSRP